MKNVRLLDSSALLSFLQREPGFGRVKHRFEEAQKNHEPLLMCELNFGEVFYVIARRRGIQEAEGIVTVLPTLPLRMVPVTWDLVLQAARLKAQYAMSYADCVAAACALSHQAALVTGDRDFKLVKDLVNVEWV